jgi:hypothetical protein
LAWNIDECNRYGDKFYEDDVEFLKDVVHLGPFGRDEFNYLFDAEKLANDTEIACSSGYSEFCSGGSSSGSLVRGSGGWISSLLRGVTARLTGWLTALSGWLRSAGK